jgi:competence protein ComEC
MNFPAWRYLRFHESYLLAWLAVGLLVGLLCGRLLVVGPNTPYLFIGCVLLLGALRSRRWWAFGAILVAGACFGSLRGATVTTQYGQYGALVDTNVTMRGVMSGDVQKIGDGQMRIVLGGVRINGQHYPGEVLVTLYGAPVLKRGDTVTASGTLHAPFASYGATLGGAKVVNVERGVNAIRDVREHFAQVVRSLVVEPMASLGLGFVVGQRSTLPASLDEQLKVVGLAHIVVASGYNLTILVQFMMRLLSRHSRYLAFTSSLGVITVFVLFSGLSPSMNRAVIVTVLTLLAWYVGRRFHPVLLILYVAAATAFWNPMYVWSDLGWYLSFFAFAGVLVVAPLLVSFMYRKREPSSFEQLVFETMSAEIMALPLIAFSFGAVPVFGLIANVLVGPFIPAAMVLTALTGFIDMVWLPLAAIFALPTTILIGYMIAVVEYLGSFSFAQLTVDFGLVTVLLWYGAIVAAIVAIQRRLGYDFRRRDEKLVI